MKSTAKVRTLDVRPLIARGEEPFQKIMTTLGALGPNDSLVLVTPFILAPLIERLRNAGFDARLDRSADGSWRTHFVRT